VEEKGEKKCMNCDTIKKLDNFGKKSDTKDGYQSWCKHCVNEYKKAKKQKN
jgi:hypothetical protein